MPTIITKDDLSEKISREIQYQQTRGHTPTVIEVSPEVHEALRLSAKAPSGARLTEHDGVTVKVNRRFIGLKAWKITYATAAPIPERVIDAARRAW